MSGKVHPLAGNQRFAVDPQDSVWLSASAGTGKTQVLSARVLRLLLQRDVHPSQILCLTFTKAGAAEMAVRVNEVLADWVRLPDNLLFKQLEAIGAPKDPDTRDRARTLFASVLDCPGGGLRIDTIHAFAQWLLAAFPEEAGLAPGTRAMEDRDRALLAREELARMLLDAEARGDERLLDTLAALSLRLGPDGVENWLMRCADAREAWFGPGAWTPPLLPRINRLLGLDAEASADDLLALCTDQAFDVASLRRCMEINQAWPAATGQGNAERIAAWLSAPVEERSALLADLHQVFHTAEGKLRASASQEKIDAEYPGYVARVADSLARVLELRAMLALSEWLAPAMELGREFAIAWEEAKEREGLIDFDDQIRRAADLLRRNELAEWIRYKLDRRFDHILVDEAQDTNEAQWQIIDALTGDFFAGAGQHDEKLRTLFVVGDYKQAIFRFQGTSPENFKLARQRVKDQIAGAAGGSSYRGGREWRDLQDLGLDRSYRTAQPVLDFVDAAIRGIGHLRFGLEDEPERHVGEERPGLVTLWRPIDAQGLPEELGDEDEDGGFSRPDRELADRIARQIRRWMDIGFPLVKGGERLAGPGDVMVLVRKRKELAGLIVARLYAAGVPVAGVDRLRLGAPLAVKDLMAGLRFAVQPFDDLNLANLLVSPLIGWSQEQLLAHAYRDRKAKLWDHLQRRAGEPEVAQALAMLFELLARADFEPPQPLLHWMLTGPWQGRRKLIARLGREANDPIDELLNAAHAYATSHAPSLQGFVQWFDAGEGELKREAGAGEGLVRVMTVHGSKGLQAPIVILADAAGDPDSSPVRGISLTEPVPEGLDALFGARTLPLPPLRKEERFGRIDEAQVRTAAEEREEHWRLLYVAMTRAEEALFIGGSLGLRETQPAAESWYAQLAALFAEDGLADDLWGERREWGRRAESAARAVESGAQEVTLDIPAWAQLPIGPEPRPPRPLAPSAAGEDMGADPPMPAAALHEAARRGVLIHRLLERLPELPPEARASAATDWLARNGAELGEGARMEIASSALAVLDNPDWADIFSADALAEVPLAATVAGRVIAGTIDRLLITPDRVLVVDFKSARRPPTDLAEVPHSTLRQMGAYAAALGVIYPGRTVAVALLYTQAPRLIEVPGDLLEIHKPALQEAQESFTF